MHPDAKVRAKLAELGIKAAKNDLVGYDQGQRGTYWEHLTNKNFYGSCKEVAGKAGVHNGTVGTFTFIAQFILSAKGYYTGAMDASCGSKLVEAITAFQKANDLDADGWCGANTWYALFN